MPTIDLNWAGVADTNPVSPPMGFTNLGAATARVVSQIWQGNNSSANTVWGCDTVPTANVFTSSIVTGDATANGKGVAIYNVSGNGFMFLARNSDIRVFAITAYVLSGSALATYTLTVANDKAVSVEVTQSTGTYVVRYDGAAVGTYVNTTYTSGLRTGLLSRAGGVKSFQLTFASAFSIDTLTDPLVPGAAVSGTQTGFFDFIMEGNFGGLIVEILPNGPNFSGTMSSFVDGGLCPLLPAAAVSGIFEQGGNTASITRAISVPNGLQELRDSSNNPTNFSGIVLGDSKYLGQAFASAGNPLTTADRSYVNPAYGLKIFPDGKIELNGTDHATNPVPSIPYTTTLWIRRGADGRVYSHDLTIDQEGIVTTTPNFNSYLGFGLGIGFFGGGTGGFAPPSLSVGLFDNTQLFDNTFLGD